MPFGFVTDRPPARRSVDLWEGVPNGFAGSLGRLDGAGQALAAIAAFLSGPMAAFHVSASVCYLRYASGTHDP